jgi:hypothetical protein
MERTRRNHRNKSRRKHPDLLRAIEKVRRRSGGKHERLTRSFRTAAKDSFAEVYLD